MEIGWWTSEFFVNLSQAQVIWEEGISREKNTASDRPVGKSGGVFLTNDCRARAQPTVDSATWADGPGLYKKSEQTLESKQ